jgi:hypothetical protein
MKATTCLRISILTAIFVLQISPLLANSDGTSVSLRKEISISVAPTVPKEATFEDIPEFEIYNAMTDLKGLAPVTPEEATFEDDTVIDLTPVTPAKAGFEESDL